jgi:hypothetical protein
VQSGCTYKRPTKAKNGVVVAVSFFKKHGASNAFFPYGPSVLLPDSGDLT